MCGYKNHTSLFFYYLYIIFIHKEGNNMKIKQIFNHIVTKLYNPLDHIKNYECDKDGLVPKFNNKGGKNGQRKKIKSWKKH